MYVFVLEYNPITWVRLVLLHCGIVDQPAICELG